MQSWSDQALLWKDKHDYDIATLSCKRLLSAVQEKLHELEVVRGHKHLNPASPRPFFLYAFAKDQTHSKFPLPPAPNSIPDLVQGLTLRCGAFLGSQGCKFTFCVHQMIWYWYHMSRPDFLKWFDTGIVYNLDRCPFHNHAWRPCLLNLGFLCHMPSITKCRAVCLGPPSPPNEPYNFLC